MHVPINVKPPNNISEWQMGFNSAFKGLSLCRRGFQDLLKVRPSSVFILCGCISSSIASLMSRSTYPCLWRWNRQSVPKRRYIKFRRRGITQKKTYNKYSYCAYWEVGIGFTNSVHAILILYGVSVKIRNYDILTSCLSPRVLVLNVVLSLICSKFHDDFFSSA